MPRGVSTSFPLVLLVLLVLLLVLAVCALLTR